jgi:hypothetical protein
MGFVWRLPLTHLTVAALKCLTLSMSEAKGEVHEALNHAWISLRFAISAVVDTITELAAFVTRGLATVKDVVTEKFNDYKHGTSLDAGSDQEESHENDGEYSFAN